MSAHVAFLDADVLSAAVLNTNNLQGPLSVDLPKAGDLPVKEHCCSHDSAPDLPAVADRRSIVGDADLSRARDQRLEQGKKARAKRKARAMLKPSTVLVGGKLVEKWPCGHATSFADFGDQCYHCVLENPPVERELSRRRIDRRQRAAQRYLVGCAPIYTPHDTNNDAQLDAPRRGKWYSVTACRIVPLDVGMSLEQWSSGKVDRHGVFFCGSTWTCPSCSQRVAVTRSAEIRDVQIAIDQVGGITVMITWTIPHDRETPLTVSMDRLKVAFRKFRQDKTVWNRLIEECGYLGHVTSTEITLALKMDPLDPLTFFDNGWHCHAHTMMGFRFEGAKAMTMLEEAAFSIKLKDIMFASWSRAVLKAGAPRAPSEQHGFDIRPAWSATTYIQKMEEIRPKDINAVKPRWGIEAELTKSYMKEGRKKSRTPFELLDSDDPKDRELYRQYARATFGRSQIEWSRGKWSLRKQFLDDAAELSDEQAASADPKWEFADERTTGGDHVVEQVFIARDDCWRARKSGRNAMARAIADVDGGGCDSLEQALRENGFVVERVRAPFVRQRVALDENLEPITKEEFVWYTEELGLDVDGDPISREYNKLELVDVMEDVHIPKMVWVTFPERSSSPPLRVVVDNPNAITSADCPF